MTAWNVYLNGKKIDTVFYNDDIKSEDVKSSLINHDGYDSGIKLKKDTQPRTFAFLTTDSFRIEVKAKSTKQAYYRAKKEAESKGKKITKTYTTYGRDGIDSGWRGMK